MVQLKLEQDYSKKVSSSTFQFHNGTIKTTRAGISTGAISGFQFHNGTIKTCVLVLLDCISIEISIP